MPPKEREMSSQAAKKQQNLISITGMNVMIAILTMQMQP